MNNEKEYLQAVVENLNEIADSLADADDDKNVQALLEKACEQEHSFREQFSIGARFSVIQSQLKQLLSQNQANANVEKHQEQVEPDVELMDKNHCVVYVHLYNAHGRLTSTWDKFLAKHAFNEHSVNRPIYAYQESVEKLIRSKKDACNHGFLEIKVELTDITADANTSQLRDANGETLIRLRQGALKLANVISFHCDGQHFKVSPEGGLILG